jgi:hypothetical protein
MKHIKMFRAALAALVVLIGLPTELYGDWVYNGSDTITEVVEVEGTTPWKIYVGANGDGFLTLKKKTGGNWGSLGTHADGTTSKLDFNAPIRLSSDASKTYKINAMQESHFKEKTVVDVVLPDAMTAIPAYCFRDCVKLTNIVIGVNVSSIGEQAFKNTSKLKCDLIFNAKKITAIGKEAFYGCGAKNIIFNGEITQSAIGANVFRECVNLNTLKLSGMLEPAGLNSFGDYSFMGTPVKELWMPKYPTFGSRVWERRNSKGISDYSVIIYINPYDAGWKSVCKRWNNLTDAQKAKWTRTDIKPIGLTTATPANQWLVEIPHNKGFYISIR